MDGKKAFQFYLRQARAKPKRPQPALESPSEDAPNEEGPDVEKGAIDAHALKDEAQLFVEHLMQYPPVTAVKIAPSGDLMLYRGKKREVIKAPERKEGISKTDWDELAELAKLVAQVKNAVADVSLNGATLLIEYTDDRESKEIRLHDLLGGGGGGVSTVEKGWSPVFAVVEDGERRLLQVKDWIGGGGTKPAAGKYIGAEGFVDDSVSAVDIGGPKEVFVTSDELPEIEYSAIAFQPIDGFEDLFIMKVNNP